ncbi:MAG: hypothetical protein JXR73_22335 [Candidatus Omnitrophica bacterium]|nr:hypothetical protein [Candidatus Omnitrophota bacterium]
MAIKYTRIERYIIVFNNSDDSLVTTYSVDNIPFEQLWKIAGCPSNDYDPELCYDYPILTDCQKAEILKFIDIRFNEKYSYFFSSTGVI